MTGNLFIISAPSGTGKTTILKPIINELAGISFSVSHTTRGPRANEQDGVDYFFTNENDFIKTRDQDGFLEWAKVHDNYYGTAREVVLAELAKGRDIILDIDVQGARQICQSPDLASTSIFIVPPSWQELERRLRGRKTDSDETIKLRLKNANREMEDAELYDYLVVNDNLQEAVELLRAIIIEKRVKNRRGKDGNPLTIPELQ